MHLLPSNQSHVAKCVEDLTTLLHVRLTDVQQNRFKLSNINGRTRGITHLVLIKNESRTSLNKAKNSTRVMGKEQCS